MPENIEPFAIPIPVEGDVPDVPKDMKALAERLAAIFKGRLLRIAEHAVSFAAAEGEMVKATATLTVTLPAPAADATVGVICAAGETTIKMTGAKIFGDFITGAEQIKLLINQHVVLQSDGTNWYIVAGEAKREQTYSGEKLTVGELAQQMPNETRPSLVTVTAWMPSAGSAAITVGPTANFFVGEVVAGSTGGSTKHTITFLVPAGHKWKWTGVVTKLDAHWITL